MAKVSFRNTSIAHEGLHGKLALGASFMFIIPLLLVSYLIFVEFAEKATARRAGYAETIIVVIIASGIFGYFILRRSVKGILRMVSMAKEIAQGKFDSRIDINHKDELSELSQSFNKITSDLESKIRELENSNNLTRELFQKIGHAITSTDKMESLLNIIIQSTKKVLQAEACLIALYERNTKKLRISAYSGHQSNLGEGTQIPDNKGIIGFTIDNRRPMVLKKIGMAITAPGSDNEIIKYTAIALCVPIFEKSRMMGVMCVCDTKNTASIENEDLFLVENIAGQVAKAVENFELNRDIEETYYQTLVALARAVEAKDHYSAEHLERVSKYADMVAEALGLDEETKKIIKGGSVLHDLGKVGIRDDILHKEGKLTAEEFEVMKNHSIIGENILKPLRSMAKVGELIRHHHEHYDGSGYPDGLKGEAIPITSRILTLVDIYDALSTERPYKKAMSSDEAITTIREYAGTLLDPKIVEVFIEALRKKNGAA